MHLYIHYTFFAFTPPVPSNNQSFFLFVDFLTPLPSPTDTSRREKINGGKIDRRLERRLIFAGLRNFVDIFWGWRSGGGSEGEGKTIKRTERKGGWRGE